jgi:hypothetical protein
MLHGGYGKNYALLYSNETGKGKRGKGEEGKGGRGEEGKAGHMIVVAFSDPFHPRSSAFIRG